MELLMKRRWWVPWHQKASPELLLPFRLRPRKFDIGDPASGERAAAEAEDGGSVGGAGIDDVDGAVAVVFVGDPGGGRKCRDWSHGRQGRRTARSRKRGSRC